MFDLLTTGKGFREAIMCLQQAMIDAAKDGKIEAKEYPLEHYFTPLDEKYGCYTYARVIFMPKGDFVIGKIHKQTHLNFLMKGRVSVATEFGREQIEAPNIWVSKAGTKRAVYVEEDAIWAGVFLTEHQGEENLDKIEEEVIARAYEDVGNNRSISSSSTGRDGIAGDSLGE